MTADILSPLRVVPSTLLLFLFASSAVYVNVSYQSSVYPVNFHPPQYM